MRSNEDTLPKSVIRRLLEVGYVGNHRLVDDLVDDAYVDHGFWRNKTKLLETLSAFTSVLYLFHVPGDEFLVLFSILCLLTIWRSHRYHMPTLDPRRQDTLEPDTSTQSMRATSALSRTKAAPVGTCLGTLEANPAYEGPIRIPKLDFHPHQWEDDGGRTAATPA